MSNLISGVQAFNALCDGEEVLFISESSKHLSNEFWGDSERCKNFTVRDFLSGQWVFKLKPKGMTVEQLNQDWLDFHKSAIYEGQRFGQYVFNERRYETAASYNIECSSSAYRNLYNSITNKPEDLV